MLALASFQTGLLFKSNVFTPNHVAGTQHVSLGSAMGWAGSAVSWAELEAVQNSPQPNRMILCRCSACQVALHGSPLCFQSFTSSVFCKSVTVHV